MRNAHRPTGICLADARPVNMSAANRALIDDAVDFVLQHYGERLTVRRLAETLGCRRPELDRLFRQRFGLTVPYYVRHVRLEHAD